MQLLWWNRSYSFHNMKIDIHFVKLWISLPAILFEDLFFEFLIFFAIQEYLHKIQLYYYWGFYSKLFFRLCGCIPHILSLFFWSIMKWNVSCIPPHIFNLLFIKALSFRKDVLEFMPWDKSHLHSVRGSYLTAEM